MIQGHPSQNEMSSVELFMSLLLNYHCGGFGSSM